MGDEVSGTQVAAGGTLRRCRGKSNESWRSEKRWFEHIRNACRLQLGGNAAIQRDLSPCRRYLAPRIARIRAELPKLPISARDHSRGVSKPTR